MLVHRSQKYTLETVPLLNEITATLQRHNPESIPHEQIVELLIQFGELESGLTDTLFSEFDSTSPLTSLLRQASTLVGHLFYLSHEERPDEAQYFLYRLRRVLETLSSFLLPHKIQITAQEGYAHYSLFPEMYLVATGRFLDEVLPRSAVCMGIRSIGTSLSGVVAAALEQQGYSVASYTVRPRGHPFNRQLLLSEALEKELRSFSSSHFLIVDEGPGLSGSSMACVAEELSRLGIDDNRIVFFPSRLPHDTTMFSEAVRNRWRRHRIQLCEFEDGIVWSGRLTESLPSDKLMDLCAGRWRTLYYSDQSASPAVQPYYERRKYLSVCIESPLEMPELMPPDPKFCDRALCLLKFIGLGHYGRRKFDRARQLAEAGFAPGVLGLSNGFIQLEFLRGRPLSKGWVKLSLLDRMVEYLALVKRLFTMSHPIPLEENLEMMRTNITEILGEAWTEGLLEFGEIRNLLFEVPTVALDGRMLPHEWLSTSTGFVKTDGEDHHEDDFFPGSQDIAWDLAATVVEFGLGEDEQEYLMTRYQTLQPDPTLAQRLSFYILAYLCFRAGYTTLASQSLLATPEGAKLKSQAKAYTSLLRQELLRPSLLRHPVAAF